GRAGQHRGSLGQEPPRRAQGQVMRVLRLTLVALAAGVALAQPARAGLFEDDEARKAILELRGKVQANEDLANKRAEQLNTLIQDQIQPLRRSVLDLNAQID